MSYYEFVPAAEYLCRTEYRPPFGVAPGARIVRCNLVKGHDGDHDEIVDGYAGVVTWPQEMTYTEAQAAGPLGGRRRPGGRRGRPGRRGGTVLMSTYYLVGEPREL